MMISTTMSQVHRLISGSLSPALVFALLAGGLAFVLSGCADGVSSGGPQPSFYRNLARSGARLDEATARNMINGYRKSNGAGEVVLDQRLVSLARAYAASLATTAQTRTSVRPDGKLNARLLNAGYSAAGVREVVTAGYHTFAEAFSGWRDSPPHRKVMLMGNATDMGIAAAYAPNTKYKVYWVLIMAQPK